MRVIAGSAKGFGLSAPKHLGLRPTPERVKEAVFSSLAERIPGARVLDLFAGTGAFGIEALSRGAASAVFVEKDGRAMALVAENLRKTRLGERARMFRDDARHALEVLVRERAVFDLVFADPPYFKPDEAARGGSRRAPFSWTQFLLDSELLPLLVAPGGVFLLEHFVKDLDLETEFYATGKTLGFGDTRVQVFTPRA
ncbi:MAG: 16S rRNA (guanine(966)-N(2))-methyltransferase RsmD [Verrucomicrobiae bacterium]|nr:16S rRNA (guanine(966)-N(2))-methyltransferase RsmD [Verrucomicrobiae bacterium]